MFIKGDIVDEVFKNMLIAKFDFDVVICWNIGTCWSKETLEFYIPRILNYGLNIAQIYKKFRILICEVNYLVCF
jgi:hypothetical protein